MTWIELASHALDMIVTFYAFSIGGSVLVGCVMLWAIIHVLRTRKP